jgi:hypothetical protein
VDILGSLEIGSRFSAGTSALSFSRLRKKCFLRRTVTSAAKAGAENKPVIAAVNRCATQNQVQHRVFPQPVRDSAGQGMFFWTLGLRRRKQWKRVREWIRTLFLFYYLLYQFLPGYPTRSATLFSFSIHRVNGKIVKMGA